eukprot:gene8349-53886_t
MRDDDWAAAGLPRGDTTTLLLRAATALAVAMLRRG